MLRIQLVSLQEHIYGIQIEWLRFGSEGAKHISTAGAGVDANAKALQIGRRPDRSHIIRDVAKTGLPHGQDTVTGLFRRRLQIIVQERFSDLPDMGPAEDDIRQLE